MKWVSYTRSISSRIGEENPSNTIAEQNERIARYLKKCGCSVSEKYSDRRRTAEATEGFDKLVQDGMARKFDVLQAICDFSLSENGMGQRVPI